MGSTYSKCILWLVAVLAALLLPDGAYSQQEFVSLRGRVTDASALVVRGAVVTIAGGSVNLRQETDLQGEYKFLSLPSGSYTVRITKPGFAVFEVQGLELAGPKVLDAEMVVSLEAQQVTVKDDQGAINVDPNSNAGALVIKGAALDSLSDDPDQLEQDLQALAGPSAGPNGGQIFIDGFSGGRLPPKSAIREIRVNQNPFSAEHDRLGFGRIEIFTKPGND
jgi:carboxypeptidase family protein